MNKEHKQVWSPLVWYTGKVPRYRGQWQAVQGRWRGAEGRNALWRVFPSQGCNARPRDWGGTGEVHPFVQHFSNDAFTSYIYLLHPYTSLYSVVHVYILSCYSFLSPALCVCVRERVWWESCAWEGDSPSSHRWDGWAAAPQPQPPTHNLAHKVVAQQKWHLINQIRARG